MAKITDDENFYYVELDVELDGKMVPYATVLIKKPCPLREILQRAEHLLGFSLSAPWSKKVIAIGIT
jgi:hypothetical protein